MASISKDGNGTKRVQFVGADGQRKAVRLGVITMRDAETIKAKIEALNRSRLSGTPPADEIVRWLDQIGPDLRDRLVRVGLADPAPRRESCELGAFLDDYVAMRGDVKQDTRVVYGHTRRNLVEFFGAGRKLDQITQGDAEEWRAWLVTHEGLSDNTVRRRSGIAKQFFHHAVKKHLVRANPFSELKAVVRGNEAKFHFVTREEAARVLEACPNAEWRLLFALSRYGGLRCPSEHLLLTWDDIDLAAGRMTIRSPKTEHHEGGGVRVCPIFPELRPFLEEAYELAEPGTRYVIGRTRNPAVNFRSRLLKIITRAGLQPWPKLWHNLRATRQTELSDQFPAHVVCAWLGNSPTVAQRHYLRLTEDHFQRATETAGQNQAAKAAQNPAHSCAAQNPAQTDVDSSQTLAAKSFATKKVGRNQEVVARRPEKTVVASPDVSILCEACQKVIAQEWATQDSNL